MLNASATPLHVTLPLTMFAPVATPRFSRTALFQPCFAMIRAYGSVVFVRPYVEVT